MEVNVIFRRGAGPAGIEGGIAAGAREDEAFNGPRFTTIKTGPDGALFAGRFGSVNIAENENVLAIDRKADEATHATIGAVLVPIGKNIDNTKIFPGVSTVGRSGFAATGVFWALLPVDSGIVVK